MASILFLTIPFLFKLKILYNRMKEYLTVGIAQKFFITCNILIHYTFNLINILVNSRTADTLIVLISLLHLKNIIC